jgi:hypothetical protein
MSGRRRFICPNGFHRATRLCFRGFDAMKLMTSGASPTAQMSGAVSVAQGTDVDGPMPRQGPTVRSLRTCPTGVGGSKPCPAVRRPSDGKWIEARLWSLALWTLALLGLSSSGTGLGARYLHARSEFQITRTDKLYKIGAIEFHLFSGESSVRGPNHWDAATTPAPAPHACSLPLPLRPGG